MPCSLLDRLGCDCAVHGDDLPCTTDGTGLYDELLAAGRLRIVKRTEGTSTTALIGRLLSMSKEHLMKTSQEERVLSPTRVSEGAALGWNRTFSQDPAGSTAGAPGKRRGASGQPDGTAEPAEPAVPLTAPQPAPLWMLLPTMSRMTLFFGERLRKVADATRVVYVPGNWDLFHVGHIRFLEQAKKLGDFVLVGCYSDETIHSFKGLNYPLQTMHERALNVLACKFVDDVILGASWQVTQDMLTTMNIAVVATGKNKVYAEPRAADKPDPAGLGDPFEVPRARGVMKVVDSDCALTIDVIAERIVENIATYAIRQRKKEKAEREYTNQKRL